MVWLLLLVAYQAPDDAINWDGPWKFGMSQMVEQQFASEAQCRSAATKMVKKIHKGMLAPIRFHCVSVDADLPKGAPR
ncbi:hypothetical protein EDF56_10335 [Novosphingobium sp. PhB165]|uniref:hypothetical protein n=1 Tax=Novosphingobium sp. PhB165 TaxID=2485105 RepID=UPI001050A9DF|nr:hypothetical protein [Novosphingobium sp. PhB165]TCM19400.1 hypothetical protein EDF56_10335 [Novosphingobium sp. PhB165]